MSPVQYDQATLIPCSISWCSMSLRELEDRHSDTSSFGHTVFWPMPAGCFRSVHIWRMSQHGSSLSSRPARAVEVQLRAAKQSVVVSSNVEMAIANAEQTVTRSNA